MNSREVQPVISSVIVIIDNLKYKGSLCTIEVECFSLSLDDKNPILSPSRATCKKPYFIMGKAFWEEEFGKRQSNKIKKLCDKAIKNYLEENL